MLPAVKRAAFSAAAIIAVALLNAAPASAAVGLPQVCTNPAEAGKTVLAGCGGSNQTGQIFRTPRDTDLVRVRSDGATTADWDSPAYVWRAWKDVAVGAYYDTCRSDVAEGSPVPNGACTDFGMVPRAAAPQAATFTASTTSGTAPLSTVLTWNVPNGTNCAAGGVWSGTKAASGTETVVVVANGSATLTCTVPGPSGNGAVTLSWVAPTQNTDGTAYTNPKGYFVYRGTSDPPSQKGALLPLSTLTFRVTDIPPDTVQWFGVTAVNTNDVESEIAKGSKNVPGVPTSTTFSATPIAFTVAAAVKKPRATVLTITVEQ